MSLKRSFPPVVDANVRLLILGSLPGDASLAKGQYYGHPQNKFWELVGAVIDVDLRSRSYEDRLASLLTHGIGLWDVIAEAERKGSLDTAIRHERHNLLVELVCSLPALNAVAFNGGMAAKIGRRQLQAAVAQYLLLDLPSSSPAHTIGFERKLQTWRQLTQFL